MQEFLLVAGVHLLAVMSPGPDFAMILRNSMVYSRRTGLLAAAGLGAGILLHVAYSLLGIGLIISKSVMLFNVIKLLGAAYLVYIGIQSLRVKRRSASDSAGSTISAKKDLTTVAAIRLGFLTNALNPKATLFFLALFTQVISPETPLSMKLLYGAEMSFVTFGWFAFVALVVSHKRVGNVFSRGKGYIERAFGAILVGLGLKVALDTQK